MKKIKIFLASSNELLADRKEFETELYRKSKRWIDKNIFFELEIWEDFTAKMSLTRSQDEYNKVIKAGDLFVLLAHTKVGKYTDEEFETAFGSFQETKKPFIFTYFKDTEAEKEDSLEAFKNKLKSLGHFYCFYKNFDDLWNQFNKELERLLLADFKVNDISHISGLHIENNNTTINNQTINNSVHYGDKKIPKALGNIPVNPSVFIGRGNSTKEIHKRLTNKEHLLLLVNGKGGIGKTTMASQYYFEYATYYKHLIWLVSKKGIKDAISSLAFSLQISFPDNLTQAQQIEEIIRNVSDLKKPVLLVIDNANDINDLKANNQILRRFQHTDILITSRINTYGAIDIYKVKHLDKKSADELFKYHYEAFKSEEQELLNEVLKAIGYNTLVIELLAKNLNEFNTDFKDHYPLQKLLADIQEKGVLSISKSAEIHADYKIEASKPEDIIRSMYDISPLSETEKQILSIFAVLPATSIPFSDLEQFLPNIEELDLIALKLSQKGWLDYDKALQSFKTNPIISEIAKEENKDRLEKDTQSMLSLLLDKLDYQTGIGHIDGDFEEIKNNVSYAETFINNFEFLNLNKSVLLERLGNFYSTYGNLEKALQFFKAYSKLSKELHKSNPKNIDFKNSLAISYSKLGNTHTALGNLDKALPFFEESTKLLDELHKSNPKNIDFKNSLAISYSKLGETHTAHGNLDKALQFFEDELKLTKELYESHPTNVAFKNGLAISYSKLGETHTTLENLYKALQFFEDYLKLRKELYESNPTHVAFKNGLAVSYCKLGETHTALGNLDKALPFFEDYLKLTKELSESNPTHVAFKNGLAVAYIKLGSLYIDKLGNKETGKPYLQKALVIWEELTTNFPSYVKFQNNYNWVIKKLKSIE